MVSLTSLGLSITTIAVSYILGIVVLNWVIIYIYLIQIRKETRIINRFPIIPIVSGICFLIYVF